MRPRILLSASFRCRLTSMPLPKPALTTVQAPQPSSQIQTELGKMTPALADQARAMLAETDERKRAQLTTALIRRDSNAVLDFLLAVLAVEQSATVRLAIVDSFGRNTNPKMREALSKLAASDADVRVSLLALERLRVQLIQDGRDLLNKRLENARSARDDAAVARLAAEQERWISLVRGTMLPSFLRVPPARFSVKPDSQPVRVLAFGDFGTGSPGAKTNRGSDGRVAQENTFRFRNHARG